VPSSGPRPEEAPPNEVRYRDRAVDEAVVRHARDRATPVKLEHHVASPLEASPSTCSIGSRSSTAFTRS
jgi:hypothetical protein